MTDTTEVRRKHGVGSDTDPHSIMHHMLQPVIGMLRYEQADGEGGRYHDYYISRLLGALDLMDEWKEGMHSDEGLCL